MAQSWNKKDREQRKQKAKRDKAEKMQERKESGKKASFDDMIAYLDENGNLSATPPNPLKRTEIRAEDIQIGVPEYVPPTAEELMRTGKVTFFNTAKGFGFIKDLVSQQSVFVHANDLTESIKENDKVSFEIQMGKRGPMAANVKLIT